MGGGEAVSRAKMGALKGEYGRVALTPSNWQTTQQSIPGYNRKNPLRRLEKTQHPERYAVKSGIFQWV